jgi:hypothetical protein
MQMKFQTQNSLNCYTVGGKQGENKQRRISYSFNSDWWKQAIKKKIVYIFELTAMNLKVGIC